MRLFSNQVIMTLVLGLCICQHTTVATAISVGNITANKILFLGNSLTHHDPKPSIGWTDDWGMDASCMENDYAHLVTSKIAALNGGAEPEMMAENICNYGEFEINYATYDAATELSELVDWQPDIVIFEIGDNSTASLTTEEAKADFTDGFADVVSVFKDSNPSEIFVLSTFWPNEVTDAILLQVCEEAGGAYVDIGGLYANEDYRGGWGGHPNDAGMAAIADLVWESMATTGTSIPEPTTAVLLLMAALGLLFHLLIWHDKLSLDLKSDKIDGLS